MTSVRIVPWFTIAAMVALLLGYAAWFRATHECASSHVVTVAAHVEQRNKAHGGSAYVPARPERVCDAWKWRADAIP